MSARKSESSKLYVVLNYAPNSMLIYGQDRQFFVPKLKGLGCRWTAKLKEGFTKVIEGAWLLPKKNYDKLKNICESNSIIIEEEKLKQLKPSSFQEEKKSSPPHLESVSSRSHPKSSDIDLSDSDDDEDYHRSLSAIKGVIASGKKVKKLSKKQEDRKRRKISEDESSPKKKHGKKGESRDNKRRSSKYSSSGSSYSSESESEIELSSDIDSEEEDTRSLSRRVRKIILYIKKYRR